MKHFICIFFLSFGLTAFAQNINDYQYVIVPTRFDFQKSDNQHRINTITKFNLEKIGFKAFYTTDIFPADIAKDRCKALTVSVEKLSSFFSTKLQITLKDCQNNIVFQGEPAVTKEKDFKKAYEIVLNEAFKSFYELGYKYNGNNVSQSEVKKTTDVAVQTTTQEIIVNSDQLFAQPISNGFQLVDTAPKVVLKIFKTSQADYYTAVSDSKNGVVFKKNNEWFFEYYQNDKLVSEKLDIKF